MNTALFISIFLSLVVTTYPACTIGTTSNGTSCNSNCYRCMDNLTCITCCYNYYQNEQGICSLCDGNCHRCNIYNATNTSCYICYYGYGLATGPPGICLLCNTSVAQSCSSINNCSLTGSCIDCRNMYVARLG